MDRLMFLLNAVELRSTHTKVLLHYLQKTRSRGGSYTPNDFHYFSIEELKRELATREHIPNKKEAKVLRQEIARRT